MQGPAMLYSGDPEFIQMMEQVSGELVKQNGGSCILTDDKAPVELLGIRVIDRLINEEVAYYRDIYNKQGIRAVMKEPGI